MELGFLLKKIISVFIEPFTLFFLIIIIGLDLFKRKPKISYRLIFFAIFYLGLISYSKFANFLLQPLERKYHKVANIDKSVRYIVLIGGDRFNRGWEALRLLKNIDGAKLIVSGYEGRGIIPEAIKTSKLFQSVGVNKDDLIVLPKPKDTIEEAKAIKKIVKNNKIYLVTSAYHMPRASLIFKNHGINVIEAPTNFLITASSDKWLSLPSVLGLYKTSVATHEYIGLLWFKLLKSF